MLVVFVSGVVSVVVDDDNDVGDVVGGVSGVDGGSPSVGCMAECCSVWAVPGNCL